MSSIRIVHEKGNILPERVQLMIPYADTICSISQQNSTKSSLCASSPLKFDGCSFTFDDFHPLSRCCSVVVPVDFDDARTMVPSPCQSLDHYITKESKTKHSHGLKSTDLIPSSKSIRSTVQTLHENITSVEVDERTLHCEVLEFFGLLESVCKIGVLLTLKQITDIAFSKDILLDSFNSLKGHLKEVRENCSKLKEIDRSNVQLETRRNANKHYSSVDLKKYPYSRSHLSKADDDILQAQCSDNNSAFSTPHSLSARSGDSDHGHLRKALRDKESECERLSVQLRAVKNQVKKLKEDSDHLAELEIDRSNIKRASRAHKIRAERFEDEVKQLTVRIQSKEEKIEQLQAELQETQSKLEHLAVNRITDFSEKGILQSRISELESLLINKEETHKTEMTIFETKLEDASDVVKRIRSTNETLNNDKLKLQEELIISSNEIKNLQQTTYKLDEQIKSYKNEIKDRDNRIETIGGSISRLEIEKQVLHEKASNFHRQIGEVQQDKLELMRTLDERKVSFEKSKRAVASKVEEALDERNSLLGQITRQAAQSHIGLFSPSGVANSTEVVRANGSRSDTFERIQELETQLQATASEQNRYRLEHDTKEARTLQRMKDLRERLDQSQSSNKSLQSYVDYLKKSYTGVFSEEHIAENGDN